jgi:hypothetical protein
MPPEDRLNEPDMIPVSVREAGRRADADLRARGVPHLLIGGMAVNAHGYRRATSDVDYLVPWPALSDLPGDSLYEAEVGFDGKTVRVEAREADGSTVGVLVDFVGVPRSLGVRRGAWETLFRAPRPVGGLPVIALEGLVLLKLIANRTKDGADIVELLKRQGPGVAKDVRGWLRGYLAGDAGRDLLSDYDMHALTAEHEAAGRRNPRASRRL